MTARHRWFVEAGARSWACPYCRNTYVTPESLRRGPVSVSHRCGAVSAPPRSDYRRGLMAAVTR